VVLPLEELGKVLTTPRRKNVYIILVPSIHNTCEDQMFYYNWVIPGYMFRPLNGHLQTTVNNITILFYVRLKLAA